MAARKSNNKTTSPKTEAELAATAMYEVLTPFKFRGAVVKPPVWIELTAEEAAPYHAAGVLGIEPGEVPEHSEGESSTDAGSGTDAAGDAAAADAAATGTDA